MTKTSAFATLLCGALVALGSAGCSRFKAPGQEAMGTVTFMLSATGASGEVYRLRSATFMVTGPETKSIMSPTDPADTLSAITSQLLPGAYQIALATGWQMWRIPSAGNPVAIPATLISPATLPFTVTSGQDSKVIYQFDVAGDALVPGTLTIGIGVTEVDAGVAGPPDAAATAGATGTAGAAGTAGATGTAGAAGTAGATGTAGAAGSTGAAGATSACGNGVVDPGEQCDSAAAFANNTCDATTCQTIPVVCGNHLVQPGERCDDGPAGSATCSATCMTVGGVSACLMCETQGSIAHPPAPAVCLGTKLSNSATAPIGCAALSTADAVSKCMTLVACLQTHPNCSISPIDTVHMTVNNDPTACFCGPLDPGSCAGAPSASIAGDCASTYFAIYGGVSNANRDAILGDFFAKATPTGMANNVYACDVNASCQSQCP
jgi:hypothetical protein